MYWTGGSNKFLLHLFYTHTIRRIARDSLFLNGASGRYLFLRYPHSSGASHCARLFGKKKSIQFFHRVSAKASVGPTLHQRALDFQREGIGCLSSARLAPLLFRDAQRRKHTFLYNKKRGLAAGFFLASRILQQCANVEIYLYTVARGDCRQTIFGTRQKQGNSRRPRWRLYCEYFSAPERISCGQVVRTLRQPV